MFLFVLMMFIEMIEKVFKVMMIEIMLFVNYLFMLMIMMRINVLLLKKYFIFVGEI